MKGAAHAAELRRHARLAVELEARRKTPDGYADERILNLSTGGLALETRAKLPPGNLEQLLIRAPDGSFETHLQAEVVRVHRTAQPGRYVAGLRFRVLDAGATQQLEQLMLRALTVPSGKRHGPRLEVRHEVFWSSGGWTGAAAFELLNVSQSGALLSAPELPAPQALGLLSLRADGADDLLAVPAQVVWRRKDGDGELAGVRFGKDPSAATLVRRILQRLLFHHPRPVESATPGTRIGEYQLGALLFRGQSLEIYRAGGREGVVALKRFCGNPADVAAWTERFVAQAKLGPTLNNHPGIVRVHGAIADAEECWLATELVEGQSLEQRMVQAAREGRRLKVSEVLAAARDLLATLEDCHSYILDDAGHELLVLHGDIRPSNVLFDPDGRARLAGFGSPFEMRLERLPWLPPEALEGGIITAQSDVYQVGVLLYEALTGVLPFRAESVLHALAAMLEVPAPVSSHNPEVPATVDALVLASLAADPRSRPESAAELAEGLGVIDLDTDVTEPDFDITEAPVESAPRPRSSSPRRRVTRDQFRPMPSPPAALGPLAPGQRIGRYELLGKLTQGGMSELFLARAGDTPWAVVVKTIHTSFTDDSEVVSLFMNEARVVSQIDHRNVVRIIDIGFDRLSPFIAMEYFASRTLSEVMAALERARRPMPIELAAYIVAEAAAGLEAAHTLRDTSGKSLHLVHRDVTAKNLLLGYDGEVKVADFGIARDGVEAADRSGARARHRGVGLARAGERPGGHRGHRRVGARGEPVPDADRRAAVQGRHRRAGAAAGDGQRAGGRAQAAARGLGRAGRALAARAGQVAGRPLPERGRPAGRCARGRRRRRSSPRDARAADGVAVPARRARARAPRRARSRGLDARRRLVAPQAPDGLAAQVRPRNLSEGAANAVPKSNG
ncbi:MAG: protein kinase [Archangiaceae bacterium]|nr:protein kinase [Archangiaceae bacterium]